MKKRILLIAMAVFLIVSVLPIAIFANAEDAPTEAELKAVSSLENGDSVVIVDANSSVAVSTAVGASNKPHLSAVAVTFSEKKDKVQWETTAAPVVFTVKKDTNGNVAFMSDGYYLAAKNTSNDYLKIADCDNENDFPINYWGLAAATDKNGNSAATLQPVGKKGTVDTSYCIKYDSSNAYFYLTGGSSAPLTFYTVDIHVCADEDNDHYCDDEDCGKKLSECIDSDEDHYCDYSGCAKKLSSCEDTDDNHYCDHTGCAIKLSNCEDVNDDHYCDHTGCAKKLSNCEDTDDNHYCDHTGCAKKLSNCEDLNDDHYCDHTGCAKKLSNCEDLNDDHYCDHTGCAIKLSECEDEDCDHKCDYCNKVISEHKGILQNAVMPTLTSAGHKAYYKCECGMFFEDEDCTVIITDLEKWKSDGGLGYLAKLENNESPKTGNAFLISVLSIFAIALAFGAAFFSMKKAKKSDR